MHRELYEVIMDMKDAVKEYPGKARSFYAHVLCINTYKARDILNALKESGYIYEEKRKYYPIGAKP